MDNDTAVGVVTSAGETEVTAATIAARSDLFMFLNLSDAAKITTNPAGDLTQWEAVNDSTFQFVPDGGSGLTISDFGSNGGKSVDFDGAYMLKDDTTAAEPADGTVCFLFNSQDDQLTEYYPLIDWYRWRIWVADAKLAYYGSPTLTDLSVADNTDYMVTVRRNDAGGTFEWRLENMATGVVTTDSTGHGSNSSGTGLFNIGGNSSYSPTGTEISNLIVIESYADADVEECELYLRQYYRGVAAGSTTYTAGKFVAELEIQASH